jgi:hypothetical protein
MTDRPPRPHRPLPPPDEPPDPPFDREAAMAWRVILCLLAAFWIVIGALLWRWLS